MKWNRCLCLSVTNELAADQTFKPQHVNVVKVGAGDPSCSYSFQVYWWIMIRWVTGFGFASGEFGWAFITGVCKRLLLSFFLLFIDNRGSLWCIKCLEREIVLWKTFTSSPLPLSSKNVLTGTVLSVATNHFYSYTIYCRGIRNGCSLKRLENKLVLAKCCS